MEDNNLIHYEHIHSKIKWKYSTKLNDFEDIKISDLNREIGYCYGSNQYIMRFIEVLKDKVIRNLPELNEVKIILGIFDKNNILHRLMVEIYYLINDILKRANIKKNFYKTIFTIIKYKGEVVFIGDISFDGIE